MISVPVSTEEKPLTAIDFCAALQQCTTVTEVARFGEQCPAHVRNDERFTRAVAAKLGAIREKKAAA